jgi:hypothetical protein
VHKVGYREKTPKMFRNLLSRFNLKKPAKEFAQAIIDFLKKECSKVPKGEFRLGCIDILESIFGKFKEIETQTN